MVGSKSPGIMPGNMPSMSPPIIPLNIPPKPIPPKPIPPKPMPPMPSGIMAGNISSMSGGIMGMPRLAHLFWKAFLAEEGDDFLIEFSSSLKVGVRVMVVFCQSRETEVGPTVTTWAWSI